MFCQSMSSVISSSAAGMSPRMKAEKSWFTMSAFGCSAIGAIARPSRGRCERKHPVVVDDRLGCDECLERGFDHRGEIALESFRSVRRAANGHNEAQDPHFALGKLTNDQ